MKKKILAIVLATIVIVSFSIVGASAALSTDTARVDEEINPSTPKVEDLVRFGKAWADIYNITALPTAQLTFVALQYFYYPIYSEGSRGQYSFIYQVGDTNMSFSGFIEEWGQKFPTGGSIYYLPLANTCKYTVKDVVVNENTGNIGISTANYGTTTDSQYRVGGGGNSGGYRVLLYVEPGHAVIGGINDIYTEYKDTNFSTPIRNIIKRYEETVNTWLNGSSGGGFTQDDLDNAYDDGYMDGEQSGYHQGAQDGYANGYANGYDEGYSFSAGAEEIESAYADGKADGVTEGYTNGYTEGYDDGYAEGIEEGTASEVEIESAYADGKADGVTEGYTNGYTAGYDTGYDEGYDTGYDNGVETGYADGKADGLVEGYQNGKADGVTEGYTNGYTAGYDTGYDEGYDTGYDYGYNLGESLGSTKIDIGEIISAVPEGAKSIINGALGFEIFGINVAGTLTALLVVAIVAYVVKKLMSR